MHKCVREYMYLMKGQATTTEKKNLCQRHKSECGYEGVSISMNVCICMCMYLND